MKLKVSGVPVGQYNAIFNGAEPRAADDKLGYGPGMLWKFIVEGTAYDGQEVGRITGDSPTGKNACGKFVKAIAGALPQVGVEIDINKFVGQRYSILVEETQSGSTRVATAVALQGGNL